LRPGPSWGWPWAVGLVRGRLFGPGAHLRPSIPGRHHGHHAGRRFCQHSAGWPLSAWMEARWGWRGACAGWADTHLLLGLPLNAALPRPPLAATVRAPTERQRGRWRPRRRAQRASQCGHRFGLGAWPRSLPSPGSSAPPWPPICPTCCNGPVWAWVPLSAWRRWSGRRRWRDDWPSVACYVTCIPCCTARLAAVAHPARRHWGCCWPAHRCWVRFAPVFRVAAWRRQWHSDDCQGHACRWRSVRSGRLRCTAGPGHDAGAFHPGPRTASCSALRSSVGVPERCGSRPRLGAGFAFSILLALRCRQAVD
jgi:hypothetical protein